MACRRSAVRSRLAPPTFAASRLRLALAPFDSINEVAADCLGNEDHGGKNERDVSRSRPAQPLTNTDETQRQRKSNNEKGDSEKISAPGLPAAFRRGSDRGIARGAPLKVGFSRHCEVGTRPFLEVEH